MNAERTKRIRLVSGLLVIGAAMVFGKAYFDRAEPSDRIRPNHITAGSTARESDSAKSKLSHSVDLTVLTQASDYKPAQKEKTVCAIEYNRLALLSSEELMRSIMRQEAEISEACMEVLQSKTGRGAPTFDEIRAACRAGIYASSCLTPIIGLKTDLIDVGTESIDPQDLPNHVLLSKLYSRSGKKDKTVADMQSSLALLDELESRGALAGFQIHRLSLLTDLAYKDKKYLGEFEALAEKTEVESPEDALAYRYKYHWQSNEPEKIESLVREHLQKHPESARAHYYLAIAAHEKGDMEAAVSLVSKSLELNPTDVFVQEQLQILKKNPRQWKQSFVLPGSRFSFGG